MDHEQLEENISLYALGALEPDSAREVEQHLATGCPACSTLLRQYQAAVTALPYALPSQAPPPELKSRIMTALSGPDTATAGARTDAPTSSVPIPTAPPDLTLSRPSSGWIPQDLPGREKPAPPRLSRRREFFQWRELFPWWEQLQEQLKGAAPALAAALGVLLLGVGGFSSYLYTTLKAERVATAHDRAALAKAKLEIADLNSQLEHKQAALTKATTEMNRAVEALGTTHELLARNQEQLETLQAQLKTGRGPKAGSDDLVRILTSPTAKMASLSGTDAAKEAYAMVFVEPGTRQGFFYAHNLPKLPAGKTYQLWIITDKPISAGVFALDRGRKGRVFMRDIPDVSRITKFAVSLEPAGGRPQPTGSIYLAGGL